MTSMIIGLPDRYRPLDEVGPEEVTPTGIIRCWRAKDRVLNRDVAIRVHTPGGPAAHAWIARALTAGGLATPALAMVYDAAEGGPGEGPGQESPAYVVNEWIDGETLAERLARGPLPEREARTVLRRLADGVAEAHRAGLAVGGLTPERVVVRPNGLVGVRAVPAATGTVQGDITALGELLEACLTGHLSGGGRIAQPDLAALIRRARSVEPSQSLSSAAAMAAALADRPRTRGVAAEPVRSEEPGGNWLRKLRERGGDTDAPVPPRTRVLDAEVIPGATAGAPAASVVPAAPVAPAAATVPPAPAPAATPPTRTFRSPVDSATVATPPGAVPPAPPGPSEPAAGPLTPGGFGLPDVEDDELIKSEVFGGGTDPGLGFGSDNFTVDAHDDAEYDADESFAEDPSRTAHERQRRRLLVVGMPVLALAIVMGVAWWLGSNVLSVAGSVDAAHSAPPSVSASTPPSSSAPAGQPLTIRSASVFDPFGDGQPENDSAVPLSFDGKPATVWNTLQYRSAALGNLKPGVGVLYDLGTPQNLSGVTITSTLPGATMEIRAGDQPKGSLDSYKVVGSGTVDRTTDIRFSKPVTARFLLVWITKLPPSGDGFEANIAEIAPHAAR